MNAGDLDGSFGLLADDCTWFSEGLVDRLDGLA
jgi:hypothetical protein